MRGRAIDECAKGSSVAKRTIAVNRSIGRRREPHLVRGLLEAEERSDAGAKTGERLVRTRLEGSGVVHANGKHGRTMLTARVSAQPSCEPRCQRAIPRDSGIVASCS